MRRLYFAYGSNLDVAQMQQRCPGAAPICTATLPDHELSFTGISRGWSGGVATVKSKRGSVVPGALYTISRTDWAALDRYEGFPRLYIRASRRLHTRWGEIVAILYLRSGDEAPSNPSPSYLESIRRGYASFGLDLDALTSALEAVRARSETLRFGERR